MYSRTVLIGTLIGDAMQTPDGAEPGVQFAVGVEDQTVPCQERGDYASKLAPHLRHARLVLVAGAIRLHSPDGPFLDVRAVRFLADDGAGAKVAGNVPFPMGTAV